MKFTIKKYVLQSALDKTFSVTGKASNDPVLASVYCRADDGKLEFCGSDGEITVITSVQQVEVQDDGDVLLPPRFYSAVKQLAEADVNVELVEGGLHLECLDYSGTIRLEHDDYPEIDREFANPVRVSKTALATSLAKMKPALMTDNIRVNLLFVQIHHGVMRATDGMKTHQVDFPFNVEMLLPAKAMEQVLRRVRSMALEDVQISETDRNFLFQMDEDLLIATKYAQDYPDIDAQVLEPAIQRNVDEVSVDRKALLGAINRVAIMADLDTNFMGLSLNNNVMVLTATDKNGNEARERIDVHWPHSDRLLGFNHNFFSDVLGAMGESQITIALGPAESSILFKEAGFIGVLQQLRSDLGAAAKGSKRQRAAQQEPIGWGHKGLTSDDIAALKEDDAEEDFSDVSDEEVSFAGLVKSEE